MEDITIGQWILIALATVLIMLQIVLALISQKNTEITKEMITVTNENTRLLEEIKSGITPLKIVG
jgi:hypothetical protein